MGFGFGFGFGLGARFGLPKQPRRLSVSCARVTRQRLGRRSRVSGDGLGGWSEARGSLRHHRPSKRVRPVCVWEPEAVAPEPACIQPSPALLDDVGSHERKCRVDAGDSVAVLADAAS